MFSEGVEKLKSVQTMGSSENETRDFTKQLSSGCEEAWTTFHTLYYNRIMRWSERLLRHSSESAEVTQATFLRLLRGMKPFDQIEDLERWIKCLVHCAYVDHVRSESRRSALYQRYAEWSEMREPDPVLQSLIEERYEELVRRLDNKERQLLELSYFQRLTQSEIGERLGLSRKAVERRLSRIRKKLKQEVS